MKTTIEIEDPLFDEAKKRAALEQRSFRALVEEALRTFLEQPSPQEGSFRLRKVSVRGKGLHPEAQNLSWPAIRRMAYREHGD